MDYRIIISFVFTVTVIVTLTAFQSEEPDAQVIQAMIDEEVEQRVAEYRRVRILKCQERIFKAADIKADSIVLALARDDYRLDSVPRPLVPERPSKPAVKPPRDTTPVRPLLHPDSIE